jgi:hypothetical protein
MPELFSIKGLAACVKVEAQIAALSERLKSDRSWRPRAATACAVTHATEGVN